MNLFDRVTRTPLERTMELVGRVLNVMGELIPEDAMDVFERSFDDDGGEALEPAPPEPEPEPKLRTTQKLGFEERDVRWQSKSGAHWKWSEGRWWHRSNNWSDMWTPTPHGYVPQSSGPFTEVIEHPPVDWRGWAVPAILEVLAEQPDCPKTFVDEDDWHEHIAVLIADRIACDPRRAIEALQREISP